MTPSDLNLEMWEWAWYVAVPTVIFVTGFVLLGFALARAAGADYPHPQDKGPVA